jgi:hypothetical protein
VQPLLPVVGLKVPAAHGLHCDWPAMIVMSVIFAVSLALIVVSQALEKLHALAMLPLMKELAQT